MCLLLQGGGWISPDGARPGSSGSTKEEDFRLANGTVPHSHLPNGWFCITVVDSNSVMAIQYVMHLSSASPRGGTPADVETLQIVHFKVLVFPHPWGLFSLQSPHYLAKPRTQLELRMHFRTLFWVFEQLANTRTLHSDEN